MTVWHYKGELVERVGQVATYKFFPDHVMAPAVSGVFQIDLKSFAVEIVEPANAEALGLVSTDERCVSALAHKIRKALEASHDVPTVAFFIA